MYKLIPPSACLGIALSVFAGPLFASQPSVTLQTESDGSGAAHIFDISVTDTDAELAGVNLLINSTFDGSTGCWFYYDFQQQQLIVNGDGGWGTASSRCSVNVTQVTNSGPLTTLSLDIQIAAGWSGDKKIWARAADLSGNDSGYVQVGDYITPPPTTPDFVAVPLTTSKTVIAGDGANFSFQLKALNGYQGTISITTQLSGPGASSISTGGTNSVTLPISITGIPEPIPSMVVPYALSTTASTAPGTVTATVTLSDGTITHTMPLTLIVKPYSTPAVSVTLPSESSSSFTITATDPIGFQSLSSVDFLMNSSLSGANGCWLAWTPQPGAADGSGALAIASDDTSSWTQIAVGPLPNLAPLGNSQCSIPAGAVTSTGNGETLTLQFRPQFSALFAGIKHVYADVIDENGPTSGYISEGTWNVTAEPSAIADFQIAVTPSSQNIAAGGSAAFSATVSPYAGFAGSVDFNVSGLPAGATLTPPAPVGPGSPSRFSIQTSGDTPAGSWPITIIGTSGNLTHSAQVQLNVHSGVPIVWLGGPAGRVANPPNPNAWLYLSSDPAGSQNVASLDILFNDRVDGQHACWIYFNGVQPWLASDDGSAWTRIPGGPGIAENSQCTANYGGIVGNGYFGVVLTVSFKPGFAPANVYEDAVNKQGGDSGYQIVNGVPPTTPWSN